ncbi:MAG: hybrid sensor histidine kinase/response regulator, partial [Nannocystaceae bacterium]
ETPTNLEISKETIAARDLVGDDQEWMTDVELSSPYSGYYLLKLGRGAESIRTFYAYATVPPVEGFDTVVVLVMVPDTVMLKYPRRSIAGGIALLTLMVVMVMSMIHRLSARHINPLVDLATRVERLRDKISVSEAERGEQLTELREDAPNHEVASLEQVVGSLEMEIERGKELERKVTNLEKLEAVGRLAGGIAHDFNNLLNVMSLNVAHIRGERGISEQTRNSIEMMSGAINAGAELTRKLTHFRHGGMTRDGGQPVVEAGETIDATLGLLRQLIGDDIELLMELPKSPVFCGLSSTDLQQVVLNLVLNARDAVGVDGEITLRLSQDKLTTADQKNAEEGASGESMELSVEDNGCGMSQEEIDKVFEPFYTTKRDQGGTGFGMAGVYGIVNSAGGSIHIESSEGVGTKIIIRIPLAAPVEAQDPAHKISADVTAGRNIAGMTCLLVEDEASSLISLRKILLREGVNSLVASNGVEARDILAARRDEIDMVISDVAMPMLDGIALAEGIGENHPGLPIILVSGHFLDIEETRAQVPSVAAFIQKPINSEDLCARISEALSMSRKA